MSKLNNILIDIVKLLFIWLKLLSFIGIVLGIMIWIWEGIIGLKISASFIITYFILQLVSESFNKTIGIKEGDK